MQRFVKKYLHVNSQDSSVRMLLLFTIVAYLFALGVRLLLWYQHADIDAYWLHGNPLPIYSPDAGLYGYYAKQLASGVTYPLVSEYMPGYLVYVLVSAFHLNIDWVMFLLPAFLSSLIVIPIMIMGYALGLLRIGFYASLIGSIGINFYTRSHLGYMDTDTLNLFFPYLAIASMMMALQKRSLVWGVLFFAALVGFYYWYHSSIIIIAALVAMTLIMIMLKLKHRIAIVAAVLMIIAALFALDNSKLMKRANDYMTSQHAITLQSADETYHFANTLATVSEAIDASIFKISPLLSGTEVYVVLATAGYLLLALARPLFLLTLPMLVLGYAASVLGMRFSMYATPVLAFGFVYLLFLFNRFLPHKNIPILGTLAGIALMLYNIVVVNSSVAPYFFKKNDVMALQKFATINTKHDLIYSWWDYGWPLWYYIGSNNTLIDNGRHGSDTYLMSKLLLSPNQNFVANAARYFSQKNLEGRKEYMNEVLPFVMKTKNLNEVFQELNYTIPTKARGRNTYIMLHRDMLLTFDMIEHFALTDLQSGQAHGKHSELYISDLLKPYRSGNPIIQGDTFTLDLRRGEMTGSDGAKATVYGVVMVQNGAITASKQYNKRSPYILIIYNNTKAIYLDTKAFDSFLIQALLLDLYDKSLFEKVIQTPSFKILKLKV